MNPTPIAMNNSLENDNSSASDKSPIVIVTIKITGPTIARKALTATAFLTSLNNSIKIAADNSIPADKRRNPAIKRTAGSISDNQRFIASSCHHV
jgi:hypothetical protein